MAKCDSRGRGAFWPVGRPQVHTKIFELFCPKGLSFCMITKTDTNFKTIRTGALSGIECPHRGGLFNM